MKTAIRRWQNDLLPATVHQELLREQGLDLLQRLGELVYRPFPGRGEGARTDLSASNDPPELGISKERSITCASRTPVAVANLLGELLRKDDGWNDYPCSDSAAAAGRIAAMKKSRAGRGLCLSCGRAGDDCRSSGRTGKLWRGDAPRVGRPHADPVPDAPPSNDAPEMVEVNFGAGADGLLGQWIDPASDGVVNRVKHAIIDRIDASQATAPDSALGAASNRQGERGR